VKACKRSLRPGFASACGTRPAPGFAISLTLPLLPTGGGDRYGITLRCRATSSS